MKYFHGGIRDLNVGDILVPSSPHVNDGCPVCEARAAGRVCTVGEFRRWMMQFGERARPALMQLAGVPDAAPMDPPSEEQAVYITSVEEYAAFYASRSGHGDLYQVEPQGPLTPAPQDHFPSWTVDSARIVRVIRRRVVRTRRERRDLDRLWKKADARAASEKARKMAQLHSMAADLFSKMEQTA